MALFRAVETAEPPQRRLFEDEYAIPVLTGALRGLAQVAQLPVIGKLVPLLLHLGWPYTRSSGVVRTRLIDDLVRAAIHEGVSQLLLLGAGFDSRAYRSEETRSVAVFEVDHPATQRAKRDRLQGFAGIDIFRLENGKIVEHWDARQGDLSRYETSTQFDDDEKLVLRLAVALTQTPCTVSDDLFAALRSHG